MQDDGSKQLSWFRIGDVERLRPALEQALAHGGPSIVAIISSAEQL
jgi:hypothetical protein